jgi:hypothetical protein
MKRKRDCDEEMEKVIQIQKLVREERIENHKRQKEAWMQLRELKDREIFLEKVQGQIERVESKRWETILLDSG